jgi:hypothetical protein
MTGGMQRKPVLVVLVGLGVLFVVILTLWAYKPALDAPFVFDDIPNIVNSPAIRWTEYSWENVVYLSDSSLLRTRPVANFSFALNHLHGGLEPRGYHLANVLIHLLTGAALLWLCVLYARNSGHVNMLAASNWQLVGLAPFAPAEYAGRYLCCAAYGFAGRAVYSTGVRQLPGCPIWPQRPVPLVVRCGAHFLDPGHR